MEDFFYRVSKPAARSVAARMYFSELAKLAGVKPGLEGPEESTLAEFQRRGFFLAYAVECPVEDYNDLAPAVRRLAPTVVKRIQSSYQPKYIAPISQATQELVKLFQMTGLSDRLLLSDGAPFVDPFIGDPQNQAEFGTSLGDRLLSAVSQLR